MAFRIEIAERELLTVFALSGGIEIQAIAELKRLFEPHAGWGEIVLDLKDVSVVVDRQVMRFFKLCEARGIRLENCPSYIREWMEKEKG